MLDKVVIHPHFNPIALHLGSINGHSFDIHWYGLMYLIGFIAFLLLGRYQIRHKPWFGWNLEMLDDALFYGALGVVLGGRLGYVLFYQPSHYFANPIEIVRLWDGGMSFHGGFLGVLTAMLFFKRKYPQPWLKVMDFIAPLVPIGLGAGRLGNFINGELWGRPTAGDFGMIFPEVDKIPRHPSQLYEFALEGICLFLILWLYSRKQRPAGTISGLFLIGYGSFRFLVEFTRQPDGYLGLLKLGLSMGQWLSFPMIVIGIWMFMHARRSNFER